MKVALRIDVDTRRGLVRGVPRLLSALRAAGVRATFFVAMGPDRWGRALLRAPFERGFLAKLWRTRGIASYGLGTLLNGTLRPGPLTGAGHPGILQDIARGGHEVAPHGWDHLAWQMALDRRGEPWLREEFERAVEAVRRALGEPPAGWASPSWRCSAATLALVDGQGLAYAADTRGGSPFLPRIGDAAFRTPQLPTTLPVTEEVVGREGVAPDGYNRRLMEGLTTDGLHVYAAHAEVEGGPFLEAFTGLLGLLRGAGAEFVLHREFAAELRPEALPICGVERRVLPGRSLPVSCQVP
jgi:hypothetical protein